MWPEVLRIATIGEEILDTVCAPVKGPELIPERFINGMRELMKSKNGCGLAAPQIGIPLRFFLMKDEVVINPTDIEVSRQTEIVNEGCLSIPSTNFRFSVNRPLRVRASWFDGKKDVRRTLSGDEARIFQHELDHLDGITIITRFAECFSKRLADFLALPDRKISDDV